MHRGALLVMALTGAPPAIAQPALPTQPIVPALTSRSVEPQLQLGRGNFALPLIDYQARDGTWKRSSGIIIGHDVSPNAAVGIGFFKMTPRAPDSALSPVATAPRSKKVSVGLSLRF